MKNALTMFRVGSEGLDSRLHRLLIANGLKETPDVRSVVAYANHGRWVADCPEDNGGIACAPGVTSGVCLDCGHVYAVTWTTKVDQIEALMDARPESAQNWHPDRETVADLEAQNQMVSSGAVDWFGRPILTGGN